MTILPIKIPSFVKLFLTKYCFSPLYISIVLLVLEYLHIVTYIPCFGGLIVTSLVLAIFFQIDCVCFDEQYLDF